MRINIVIILFLLQSVVLFAQDFLVVGQVFDFDTKEPLSAVHVYNEKTMQGAETDEEGFFYIKCNKETQSIVFSSIGYQTRKIRIKTYQNQAVQVELKTQPVWLSEFSVLPGVNISRRILENVNKNRSINDVFKRKDYELQGKTQDLLIFEKKLDKIDESLLFSLDTSNLEIPLYRKSVDFRLKPSGLEYGELDENSIIPNLDKIYENFVGSVPLTLNFYDSNVKLFGKSFVSPLADYGHLFYRYVFKDSLLVDGRKIYSISFRSLNPRNLAFDGSLEVDAFTYAIKSIHLHLPGSTNLNFVEEMDFKFEYHRDLQGNWVPETENWNISINENLFENQDQVRKYFHIFKQNRYKLDRPNEELSSAKPILEFSGNQYKDEDINQRISGLKGSPVVKTAAWIADAYLTGYMRVGNIDIGRIYQLARVTELEGLRLNLPFRTNEQLSKKISLGGYIGYGTRNKEWNYQTEFAYKFPNRQRLIAGVKYTSDYRTMNFAQSDNFYKENPHYSGDADLFSTIAGFRKEPYLYAFKSLEFRILKDWKRGFESRLYYKDETLFANNILRLQDETASYENLRSKTLTLLNRISFNERNYEDHMQRIYMRNWYPVIYTTFDFGEYDFADKSGYYSKLKITATQKFLFPVGQWDFYVEGAYTIGNVPWPLKYQPVDKNYATFGRYRFSMMNPYEFIADNYIYFNSEWIFNGILFNRIPILNRLKLREIVNLKFIYGDMDRNLLMDLPGEYKLTGKPYAEMNAGISNLFRILTVQGIWRLTDNNLEGVSSSRFSFALRLSF